MLHIQKAKREDAAAAWEIRNNAILYQCAGHYSCSTLAAWTSGESPLEFLNAVETDFYLAIFSDLIVGTGMVNIETGKVDAIFVDPQHMRKGVGRTILSFLEAMALKRGVRTLNLESTLNAAAFYRACGFRGNEVRKYVSPKGIELDCIPMLKVISPKRFSLPQG